jgi:hypothetical protein
VTVYRAAKRAGRTLILDAYAAEVLKVTWRDSIPQPTPGWSAMFAPRSLRPLSRQKLMKSPSYQYSYSSCLYRQKMDSARTSPLDDNLHCCAFWLAQNRRRMMQPPLNSKDSNICVRKATVNLSLKISAISRALN